LMFVAMVCLLLVILNLNSIKNSVCSEPWP
jgi:hypothetical protein